MLRGGLRWLFCNYPYYPTSKSKLILKTGAIITDTCFRAVLPIDRCALQGDIPPKGKENTEWIDILRNLGFWPEFQI